VQSLLPSPYLSGLIQYGSDGKAVFGAQWVDTTSSDPPLGFDSGGGSASDTATLQGEVQRAILSPVSPIYGPPGNSITTSPIYVVITDPSHFADWGGFNMPGTFRSSPVNMISVGTSALSMEYRFGLTFSHELVERMTDPTDDGKGVTVFWPGSTPGNNRRRSE
jgi:hypothetical protein